MSFINKLNDTFELLNKLDKLITNSNDKGLFKKHLLSVSDDLAKYKDMHEKLIISDNDEIKSKIQDVLRRINEIEISVKNKLILTEKYNSYLNS
tara:strand:+ start:96 stop:377 length:282 start_codon:yes stop_codon:yes gene_type:complete